MEELKAKHTKSEKDKEIVFSKTIKAGKRIYYLDVKKNRKDEMFLAITESKKIVNAENGDSSQVNFEKHKLFLYKEDFHKFLHGLEEVVQYIEERQGSTYTENDSDQKLEKQEFHKEESASLAEDEIKIDIDF